MTQKPRPTPEPPTIPYICAHCGGKIRHLDIRSGVMYDEECENAECFAANDTTIRTRTFTPEQVERARKLIDFDIDELRGHLLLEAIELLREVVGDD